MIRIVQPIDIQKQKICHVGHEAELKDQDEDFSILIL